MLKINKLLCKIFMCVVFNNVFEFDNVKICFCMYVYVYGWMYYLINCLESIFVFFCCWKEFGDDLVGDVLWVVYGR